MRQKANKEYDCMACEFLYASGDLKEIVSESGMSFAEKRTILIAQSENWKVLKGSAYVRHQCSQEGLKYTFIARPEIHAICVKYDLYAM